MPTKKLSSGLGVALRYWLAGISATASSDGGLGQEVQEVGRIPADLLSEGDILFTLMESHAGSVQTLS